MRNPLSRGLLDVAQALVDLRGTKIVRQAALRRAASSAYYAVFHALCQLCGDGLKLWTVGGDDLQLAYRSVDHGRAADVLTALSTRQLDPGLDAIADAFRDLRSFREDADYSQPGRLGATERLLTRQEIETLLALAGETIQLIDNLPSHVRRQLSILLLTGLSKRQTRRASR